MIEVHLQEWLELSLRWAHLTVGIAWIGASFYFNWLENRLIRQHTELQKLSGTYGTLPLKGTSGQYMAVGFTTFKNTRLPRMSCQLSSIGSSGRLISRGLRAWHFRLFIYITITYLTNLVKNELRLSSFNLLWEWNSLLANVYLLDQSVAQLAPWQGITIGVATLAISWIFYDLICRSAFAPWQGITIGVATLAISWIFYSDVHPPLPKGLLLALHIYILLILLCNTFSGRGAFIHVGSAIGTVMVLNVMAVIVPSQKSLVRAMQTGAERDAALGRAGLTRSRHNNYLTLPVLFIMISSHYPSTFSSSWNWLILIGIAVAGIVVRHYFNVRHLPGTKWWLLLIGAGIFVLIALMTLPESRPTLDTVKSVSIENVRSVIHERCTVCHSAAPVRTEFQVAPGGIVMDTDEQINTLASRIYTTTVATRSMPIGNLSQMTEAERQLIGDWYAQLGRVSQ